jgi:hypothetical protein
LEDEEAFLPAVSQVQRDLGPFEQVARHLIAATL